MVDDTSIVIETLLKDWNSRPRPWTSILRPRRRTCVYRSTD